MAKNVSASGILVQRSDFQPPIGAPIELELLVPGPPKAIRLFADVVRHTEDGGFAAAFRTLNDQSSEGLHRLLEALSAAVDDDDVTTRVTLGPDLVQTLDPEIERVLGQISEEFGHESLDLLSGARITIK